MPAPARRPDEGGLGPQGQMTAADQPSSNSNSNSSGSGSGSREPPRKKRAMIDNGGAAAGAAAAAGDDSDEDRQEAMDMVDRANAGQPVLSGPAALGLEENESGEGQQQQQRGTTTGRAAQDGSGQLLKPGQVKKSTPVPEGANL